jgi:hypothetical protein
MLMTRLPNQLHLKLQLDVGAQKYLQEGYLNEGLFSYQLHIRIGIDQGSVLK